MAEDDFDKAFEGHDDDEDETEEAAEDAEFESDDDGEEEGGEVDPNDEDFRKSGPSSSTEEGRTRRSSA